LTKNISLVIFCVTMKRKFKMLDANIHTKFSDGDLSIDQVLKISKKKKVDVGICDHVSVDHKINSEKAFIKYINKLKKFKVKKSAEFDIANPLRISEELTENLDYVVRGLHHFKNKKSDKLLYFNDEKLIISDIDYFRDWTFDELAKTIEYERVDIIAHPTRLPIVLKDQEKEIFTDEWKDDLIKLASTNDVAFEISNRWHLPDEEFITECLKHGVNISLGSGGHTKENMCDLKYPLELIEKIDFPEFLIYPNNDIEIEEEF